MELIAAVMKNKIHLFAPLLLLFWVQPVDSKKIIDIFSQQEAVKPIHLSMVNNSVDDMYSDCHAQMIQKVKTKYFKRENKSIFKRVWQNAEQCANRNLEPAEKEDKNLTKDHLQAICVYTSDYEKFYELFNDAVRTNRSEYGTTFPFHSLHYWLTSAIQILKFNTSRNCLTSYRRSNTVFSGRVNETIRFGSFTSSSYNPKQTRFGNKTCFKIETCYGAYLKEYPHLRNKEQEVLIPPYEMFAISKVLKQKYVENLSDCKVVYILKSAGVKSNLNCKAAKLNQGFSLKARNV